MGQHDVVSENLEERDARNDKQTVDLGAKVITRGRLGSAYMKNPEVRCAGSMYICNRVSCAMCGVLHFDRPALGSGAKMKTWYKYGTERCAWRRRVNRAGR